MKAMTFSTLIWCMLTGLLAFSGGSGTSGSPWQVANKADLNEIRNYLNQDKYFEQTADITFETADFQSGGAYYNSGALWLPIGSDISNSFIGKYDGKGKKITGLRINRPSTNNVGLFGHFGNTTATSSIKDVHLEDVIVAGARGVGTLIGRVTGQLNTRTEKCSAVNGSVTGNAVSGGLIGSNNSYKTNASEAPGFRPRIVNSYANINVTFTGVFDANENIKFGGLAGCNQKGYITNCYALGSVTANKIGSVTPSRIGGLAGCVFLKGYAEYSYSAGAVSGTDATDIGGMIGYLGTGQEVGSATACFWDKETSGQLTSAYGTGKLTSEMKTASTFTSASWDFTNTWEMIGTNYPRLKANADQTLPVCLSSFSVVPLSYSKLSINWVTQSETNVFGYHVYRHTENNLTDANRVSDCMIAAYNTSTEQSYAWEDKQIQALTTYYYWLQSADLDGCIEFHGPVCITTADDNMITPPVIPLITCIRHAYPNPFNPNTHIAFELEKADDIKLEIYNLKGQKVNTLLDCYYQAGRHSIAWNGCDHYGKACQTGVYFCRLLTSENAFMYKLMILK